MQYRLQHWGSRFEERGWRSPSLASKTQHHSKRLSRLSLQRLRTGDQEQFSQSFHRCCNIIDMCSIPVCNRLSLVQARPQKRWLCFLLRSRLFPLCPTWGSCSLRLRSSWSPQLQKSLPRCFRHSQRSHVWQPVHCVIIEDCLNVCTSVVICYQTSLLWFLQSLVCPRVCKCALGKFRHHLGPESRSFPESITDHTCPQ